jgi:hypothetical protein
MKRSIHLLEYLCIGAILLNWAGQESTSGKEKPQINFKGTLTDNSDQTFNVENITISGLYKNIPLYAIPAQPEDNPEDNVTLINLAEIDALESVPHNGHRAVFKGRRYNKVIVRFKNHTESTFLVDSARKIFCDVAINKNAIEKRLAFEALRELTITEHKQHAEGSSLAETEPKLSKGHERECAQAGHALHRLNEEAQKVSGPQRNVLLELIDSAKNWVGSICSTQPKE